MSTLDAGTGEPADTRGGPADAYEAPGDPPADGPAARESDGAGTPDTAPEPGSAGTPDPDGTAGLPPDLRYAAQARTRLAEMPPPVDADAFALAHHLLQLAYLLVNDLEARVHRPRGWTLPGFRLMFKLWLLGPAQPVRLAEIAVMSRSAVTNVVNTLERAGLVERRTVPGDGRAVLVALTADGERAVREAFLEQARREQQWFGVLDGGEQARMTELLARILRARPTDVG
jgi:DNA-binding MarR family transcriptional regulator